MNKQKMRSVKINAVLNTAKTICSVIFPLITIPYVTRILTVSNYGKVSTSASIVSYFILIASLGISTYVQREGPSIRDDKKRFNQFASEILFINLISTLVSYLSLFILVLVSKTLNSYKPLIFIQSIQIILTTIGADWINSVYEDYFYITVRYLLIQVLSIVSLFLLVRTKNDYLIYAVTTVFAASGGNILNIFYIRRYVKFHRVKIQDCIKHLIPIFKLFAVNIATTIYVSSDMTILGILVGNSAAGIYQLTSKIYTVVKMLLAATLIVALPRLAFYMGHDDKDNYLNLLRNIFDSLLSIVLPAIIGLMMISDKIILLLGGNEFLKGTLSLQILSLSLIFSMLAAFFTNGVTLLYKRDDIYLVSTLISSITNIVLNFILIPKYSYNAAAFTTLIAELIMAAINGFFAFREHLIKDNFAKIFGNKRVICCSVLGSLGVIIVCTIINNLNFNIFGSIFLSILLSCLFYLFICYKLKNTIVTNNFETILKKMKKNN